MSALHFGRDGCSANDKFLAHIMDALARAHPSLLISDKICSMHSNDLIKGCILSQSMEVVSGLYSLASICRYGRAFLRMIRSVPLVVAAKLRIVCDAPDFASIEYGKQLLDYACLHH